MMKRKSRSLLIFFIATLIVIIALFGFAEAENLEWTISDAGVLTITGSGIIPPSYGPWLDDYQNQERIVEVHVGDGITEIGDFVFGSGTLPNVRTVKLPNTLEILGGQNFWGYSNLESITLPEGLTEIDYCCFWGCNKLTSITIPSTVTTIGFGAFTHCDSLLNVYVSSGNQRYYSNDGVLFCRNAIWDGDALLCYPIGRTNNTYTIPVGTISIDMYAFSDSVLETVTFPEGLRQISYSFDGCTLLHDVVFPSTLTNIGSNAFSGCSLIDSITIPDSVESMGDYIFPEDTIIYCSKNSAAEAYAIKHGHHIIYPDGSEYFPPVIEWNVSDSGVLTITGNGIIPPSYHPWLDDYQNQQRIIEIHIDGEFTEIGDFVFGSGTLPNVRSVSLPNSLVVLGGQNFWGYSNLESISLPEGLIEIDYCCFWGCDKLTSITVPSTVTTIGFGAFTHCKSLLNVFVASGNQRYYSNDGVLFCKNAIWDGDALLCYPIGRTNKKYTIPSGTISIDMYAFSDSILEEVVFPEGLRQISYSFDGCTALQNLNFPNTLTNIGSNAFSGCTMIDGVFIPDSVVSMGNYIFPQNTVIICSRGSAADTFAQKNGHRVIYVDEIEQKTLPANLKKIETEAFINSGFDFLFIPKSVTEIEDNVFPTDMIIICSSDSFANSWARAKGYKVINIE